MPLFYDIPSMIMLLPALLLSLYAQFKVKSTFDRYLRVHSVSGYTGAEVANILLRNKGIDNIPISPTRGYLSDHYDPTNKILRLSQEVYNGRSIASIGVAAHEVGHAIQHAEGYKPLNWRNAIVPLANLGSRASFFLIFLGMLMGSGSILVDIGIYLFLGVVAFQLITLPVELNASRRAVNLLSSMGIVQGDEEKQVRKVLSAAALTYVAAVVSAITQFLRLMMIRDRDRR